MYKFRIYDCRFLESSTTRQTVIYPRCGEAARNVGLCIPLTRLVECIFTWPRADDVSRMTTDRRKKPTRESWEVVGGRLTILRLYEFMTVAYGGGGGLIFTRAQLYIVKSRPNIKKGCDWRYRYCDEWVQLPPHKPNPRIRKIINRKKRNQLPNFPESVFFVCRWSSATPHRRAHVRMRETRRGIGTRIPTFTAIWPRRGYIMVCAGGHNPP